MPDDRTVAALNERRHQLAFAERQFALFLARVGLAKLKAKLALDLGEHDKCKRELSYVANHLSIANECSETIDHLRRELEPGLEGDGGDHV